jgi:nucleotide-binding universal stress UspA family protein
MFKRLLVPLDGSKLAETALPYAEEIARHLGSEVMLTNVRSEGELLANPELREYLTKMAETTEQNLKNSTDKPRGEKVKVASEIIGVPTMFKHPAEEIVDYAEKESATLIVMATHGRTGISRWALGNTADKVTRIFKSPVLLVRAKAGIPKSIHLENVLVPLDGSLPSEAVLTVVKTLAARFKSKIKLLHIVEMQYHIIVSPAPSGFYGNEGIIKVPYNDEELKPIKAAAEKYIKGVSDKLMSEGIKASYEVRVGSAGDEIIEVEKDMHPDLVVMSTHGHSGFGRWDHGSIADKVIHAGTTPLLLVRPEKK